MDVYYGYRSHIMIQLIYIYQDKYRSFLLIQIIKMHTIKLKREIDEKETNTHTHTQKGVAHQVDWSKEQKIHATKIITGTKLSSSSHQQSRVFITGIYDPK